MLGVQGRRAFVEVKPDVDTKRGKHNKAERGPRLMCVSVSLLPRLAAQLTPSHALASLRMPFDQVHGDTRCRKPSTSKQRLNSRLDRGRRDDLQAASILSSTSIAWQF
jgi:hypothetical protein